MFSIQQALVDGLIFSLVMGVLVVVSLYYNARLWLQDYPKAMQAVVPPLSRVEIQQRRWLAVGMLLLMAGIPLFATYGLKAANGGNISFISAYAHAFVVTNMFNVFDAVVLDLPLAVFKPRFAMLPGAEGLEYLFNDWRMHVVNFLKGTVFCSAFSVIVALVVMAL